MPDFDIVRVDSENEEKIESLKAKGFEVFSGHGAEVRLRRPEGYEPAEEPEETEEQEFEIRQGTPETEIEATSAAIEAAEEWGVDLSGIEGTGENGRIIKSDVEQARTIE